MDEFEYVMVLVSIIVGLGMAHQLLGLASLVDRVAGDGDPIAPSLAYFSWLGTVFTWTVLFWWWEFKFADLVTDWTVGLYFFLVLYAVVLFLLAAILVPKDWDGVSDLNEYFLQRKVWFFSLLLVANVLDVLDTYLKGGMENLRATPGITYAIWAAVGVAALVGVRSRSLRVQGPMALLVLVLQVLTGFEALPQLGR